MNPELPPQRESSTLHPFVPLSRRDFGPKDWSLIRRALGHVFALISFCFVGGVAVLSQEVTTSIDCLTSNPVSALQSALNRGGTVSIACDLTLFLSTNLVATTNVRIAALPKRLVLRGRNLTRLLHVLPGVTCELVGVDFGEGAASKGGAILNEGRLHLDHCEFYSNVAKGVAFRITGYITNATDSFFTPIVDHEHAQGGAIANYDSLFATNTVFRGNRAIGDSAGDLRCDRYCGDGGPILQGEAVRGGAVFNEGTAVFEGLRFIGNSIQGGNGMDGNDGVWGSGGGLAAGGVIYQSAGSLQVWRSEFAGNRAIGGTYGFSRSGHVATNAEGALGGAIYVQNGSFEAVDCYFRSNSTAGVKSSGGALALLKGASAKITGSDFRFNSTTLHTPIKEGPLDGGGGCIYNRGELQLLDSNLQHNQSLSGAGGALWSDGDAWLDQVRIHENLTEGSPDAFASAIRAGNGRAGIDAHGGGLFNGKDGRLAILNTTIDSNTALGGRGKFATLPGYIGRIVVAGDGKGGGLWNEGVITMTNATLVGNSAIGGVSQRDNGEGQEKYWFPGGAFGGGIGEGAGRITLDHCTLSRNQVQIFNDPPESYRTFGLSSTTNIMMASSLFVSNLITIQARLAHTVIDVPYGSSNVHALVADLGYNLNADASARFTESTSRENIDPLLGSLANRGGAVPTVNLLSGSPCLNAAGIASTVTRDARGRVRPQGAAADIGAYEADSFPELQLAHFNGTPKLTAYGTLEATYVLQSSLELHSWVDRGEFVLKTEGQEVSTAFLDKGSPPTFLRLVAR